MSEFSTLDHDELRREHRTIWIVVGVVMAALLVVMFVAWDYDRDSTEAKEKAAELIELYDAAGIATPLDAEQVAKIYGTDGGTVCRIGDDEALQGWIKAHIGVGGAFYFRATDLDRDAVEGALIAASVYCPDQLAKLQEFVGDLDLRDVVRS